MADLTHLDWTELFAMLDDWTPQSVSAERASSRHVAAWTEIHRRLVHFAATRLPQEIGLRRQDAADVAQATLLKLQTVTIWRRLRSARSIVGYLLVMLRNAGVDLRRRRQVEHDAMKRVAAIDVAGPSGSDKAILREWLTAQMHSRSSEECELLRARYWEGLSFAEIAQRMGVSYGTVAGRMFRLIRQLRENWRQD